ncbi:MAG: TIGR04141 family sporadically distributed protein [Candidatus Zixiibacteriota bacterium]|jgi:uncharacterized protein (TIGR04141 family)
MPREKKSKKGKTWQVRVVLVKKSIKDYEGALVNPRGLSSLGLTGVDFEGMLFLRPKRTKEPTWLNFIKPVIEGDLPDLRNSSSAAVLFVKVKERGRGFRLFAFTFGTGRFLLKPEALEERFGLRTVLSAVNPERIKSVDAKTVDEITLHTIKQTSQQTSFEGFGLDVSRDLLRAATGEPKDLDFAKQIVGSSEALSFFSRMDAGSLGDKCKQILKYYKSESYKDRFAWIDSFGFVKDKDTISQLQDNLINALKTGDTEKIHIAPPEYIPPDRAPGFKFSLEEESITYDLDIVSYLETVEDKEKITVNFLKNQHLYAISSDADTIYSSWKLYDCVVFETTLSNKFFVLTGGDWFKVEADFVESVDTFVEPFLNQDFALPAANPGEEEGVYNSRVSESEGLLLLDRKTVRWFGSTTPVEVCDLFSRDKQFIHVKRKTRSSTLSHLFAQGSVSAEAFLISADFRRDVLGIIENDDSSFSRYLLDDPVLRLTTSDYHVVYAIIARPRRSWPQWLPFFSRVNFRQTAERLMAFGYNVSILLIDQQ